MSIAINFWQGWDMQWGVPFHKVTKSFDHVVLQGHVKCFSCVSLPPQVLWPLNLTATYYKKLQPIKLHIPLNTWSREVTRWIKHILSPLLPKLAGWLHTMRSFLQYSHIILWSHGLVISLIRFLGLERKRL